MLSQHQSARWPVLAFPVCRAPDVEEICPFVGNQRACAEGGGGVEGEGGAVGGIGLCADAASTRGGTAESLRRIFCSSAWSLAMSSATWRWPAAS